MERKVRNTYLSLSLRNEHGKSSNGHILRSESRHEKTRRMVVKGKEEVVGFLIGWRDHIVGLCTDLRSWIGVLNGLHHFASCFDFALGTIVRSSIRSRLHVEECLSFSTNATPIIVPPNCEPVATQFHIPQSLGLAIAELPPVVQSQQTLIRTQIPNNQSTIQLVI